jgi:predicted Zn-dependent peptidase
MKPLMVVLVVTVALATQMRAQEVRLPKYTREVLRNGMVVYFMPKPGVPLVSFQIAVKGGQEAEPVGQADLPR